jgi:hypothetical protein
MPFMRVKTKFKTFSHNINKGLKYLRNKEPEEQKK